MLLNVEFSASIKRLGSLKCELLHLDSAGLVLSADMSCSIARNSAFNCVEI